MERPQILRNSKGFTIIEALVVVAIVGILMGFSYSGFTARQKKEQLRSASMLLMEYLKEEKMLAAEKSAASWITFTGTKIYNTAIAGLALHQVNLDLEYPGVYFDPAPPSTLAFNSRGMPTLTAGAFPITFVLKEAYKGTTYQCTVQVTSVGMIDVVPCTSPDPSGGPYCMDLKYK